MTEKTAEENGKKGDEDNNNNKKEADTQRADINGLTSNIRTFYVNYCNFLCYM